MTAAAPETVAATVRAMRRAGAAGEPVPATEVAAWARTFMVQLYGPQKPVRIECRPLYSVEPWIAADDGDVKHARRRQLDLRALYLHPKAEKPSKAHRFEGDSCRDCGELKVCAGPDCELPAPTPEARAALPFDPAWFRGPLQAFQRFCTTRDIGQWDAQKWKRETTYLLERLDQYDKETLA